MPSQRSNRCPQRLWGSVAKESRLSARQRRPPPPPAGRKKSRRAGVGKLLGAGDALSHRGGAPASPRGLAASARQAITSIPRGTQRRSAMAPARLAARNCRSTSSCRPLSVPRKKKWVEAGFKTKSPARSALDPAHRAAGVAGPPVVVDTIVRAAKRTRGLKQDSRPGRRGDRRWTQRTELPGIAVPPVVVDTMSVPRKNR